MGDIRLVDLTEKIYGNNTNRGKKIRGVRYGDTNILGII